MKSQQQQKPAYIEFFERCQDERKKLSSWDWSSDPRISFSQDQHAKDMNNIFKSYLPDQMEGIFLSMKNSEDDKIKEAFFKTINSAYTTYIQVERYHKGLFLKLLSEEYSKYAKIERLNAIERNDIHTVASYIQTDNVAWKWTQAEVLSMYNAPTDKEGNNFWHLVISKIPLNTLKAFLTVQHLSNTGFPHSKNQNDKAPIDLVRYDFDKVEAIRQYATIDNHALYPRILPPVGDTLSIDNLVCLVKEAKCEGGKEANIKKILELYSHEEKELIFQSMQNSQDNKIKGEFVKTINSAYKTYKDLLRYNQYNSFVTVVEVVCQLKQHTQASHHEREAQPAILAGLPKAEKTPPAAKKHKIITAGQEAADTSEYDAASDSYGFYFHGGAMVGNTVVTRNNQDNFVLDDIHSDIAISAVELSNPATLKVTSEVISSAQPKITTEGTPLQGKDAAVDTRADDAASDSYGFYFHGGAMVGNIVSRGIKFVDDQVTGNNQDKFFLDYIPSVGDFGKSFIFSLVVSSLPNNIVLANKIIIAKAVSDAMISGIDLSPQYYAASMLSYVANSLALISAIGFAQQTEFYENHPFVTGVIATTASDLTKLCYDTTYTAYDYLTGKSSSAALIKEDL